LVVERLPISWEAMTSTESCVSPHVASWPPSPEQLPPRLSAASSSEITADRTLLPNSRASHDGVVDPAVGSGSHVRSGAATSGSGLEVLAESGGGLRPSVEAQNGSMSLSTFRSADHRQEAAARWRRRRVPVSRSDRVRTEGHPARARCLTADQEFLAIATSRGERE
jgi:hypothetical protein